MTKYTKDARGCYGVCCPIIDGKEQGQFIETFDYTETKLLSIKVYKMQMQQEMTYQRKMKSQGWKDFNGTKGILNVMAKQTHWKNSPAMRKQV
jgi:hypothetical protein